MVGKSVHNTSGKTHIIKMQGNIRNSVRKASGDLANMRSPGDIIGKLIRSCIPMEFIGLLEKSPNPLFTSHSLIVETPLKRHIYTDSRTSSFTSQILSSKTLHFSLFFMFLRLHTSNDMQFYFINLY